MGNCYELLGIAPTAATEEIEEAYQSKKKEFMADASKQQELNSAYNEAIMATFAPIRAFASPLPPLATGKNSSPDAPSPIQTVPAPAQPQPLSAPESPMRQPPQATPNRHAGESADEDAPMALIDSQLINMNVSEIRNHMPQMEDENDDAGSFSLGIKNKLLRYFVKTYIAVVVFDMAMRLLVGPRWLVLTEVISAGQIPSTPMLLSIVFALVSIVYCFICALPAPFAARFFLLGQPPDKSSMMWTLFFLSIVSASLLRWLTARFLPLNIAGSAVSFVIAAMALSLGTLRYEGD